MKKLRSVTPEFVTYPGKLQVRIVNEWVLQRQVGTWI